MFWFIILTSNFHFEIHGMIGLQALVAKFGYLIKSNAQVHPLGERAHSPPSPLNMVALHNFII